MYVELPALLPSIFERAQDHGMSKIGTLSIFSGNSLSVGDA